MSRKIEWWIEMSIQGCARSGEIEFEDDATDEEIEEMVKEEVFNTVSWGWSEKPQVESEAERS